MTQNKAPETVILTEMTALEVYMLRDALTQRIEDVRETATRFFDSPAKSAESASKWANYEEFLKASDRLLAKLPEIETPEGEPPRFVHKAKVAVEPITDIDIYRATLEACLHAEHNDQPERAALLRARVDASPFSGCPDCMGILLAWMNALHAMVKALYRIRTNFPCEVSLLWHLSPTFHHQEPLRVTMKSPVSTAAPAQEMGERLSFARLNTDLPQGE